MHPHTGSCKKIDLSSWNNPAFDRQTKNQILLVGICSALIFILSIGGAAKELLAFAFANYGFHLNEKRLWAKSVEAFNISLWLSEGKNSYSYFGKAFAEDEEGKYNSAIKDYNQALLQNPENACIYNDRGLAHKALGEKDLALADYNKSALLSPKHVEHLVSRGKLLREMGHTQEALHDFLNANQLAVSKLKENPNNADNYGSQASAQYELGLNDQALSNIQEAIRRTPDYADFRLIRAKIFLAKHNLSDALDDIQMYISAYPYDQEGYLELAKINQELGNLAMASSSRAKAAMLKEQAKISG